MSLGIYAQDTDLLHIAEESKQTSIDISKELNFDQHKSMLLHRAIYANARSVYRAEQQMANEPKKLAATKDKISKTFDKILAPNFTDLEIDKINRLMKF